MKKILAMLLALMMILGMATLAHAEEKSPAGTVLQLWLLRRGLRRFRVLLPLLRE